CLVIRKRQAGDRIQLHPQLTKRISRWLIDQKIPPEQRAQAWVASNPENKIYSFLPFVNSYLSIDAETDKIRYILVYRYLA
ncbi:MAG TPA: tRNA lysidine(34) synthetase TilS, partial [Enterococcus columbae]|nr:tRNA lysidine(34) synthetase TilS [Enterococcus columbae]